MVSFAKVITPEDAEAIRAYVVTTANEAKNAPPATRRAVRVEPGWTGRSAASRRAAPRHRRCTNKQEGRRRLELIAH